MTLLRLAGRRTFKSLRAHRNYRLFFAGQITSVCGTWMQNIAMYWLVLTLTKSHGFAVGILSLCRFGPFTIFGLLAGVVADRLDNRRTVIVTQAVQMAFSALLAVITLAGHVHVWEVYAIAFATGTALVLTRPPGRASPSSWSAATSCLTRSRSTRASSTLRGSSARRSPGS